MIVQDYIRPDARSCQILQYDCLSWVTSLIYANDMLDMNRHYPYLIFEQERNEELQVLTDTSLSFNLIK